MRQLKRGPTSRQAGLSAPAQAIVVVAHELIWTVTDAAAAEGIVELPLALDRRGAAFGICSTSPDLMAKYRRCRGPAGTAR